MIVDRAAHADDLRALTREDECQISHFGCKDSGRTPPRRDLTPNSDTLDVQ